MAMAVVLVSRFKCNKMIANIILQAQYAVSADNTFAPRGGTTNIDYEQMFNKIKGHATKILQQETHHDKATVKMWEDFVFKGASFSIAETGDNDDEEDEFAAVDALIGRPSNSRDEEDGEFEV